MAIDRKAYTEADWAAIQKKLESPEETVLCPRCSSEMLYERRGNSVTVECKTEGCIFGGTIGLFRELYGAGYPALSELAGEAPIPEADRVAEYLERAPVIAVASVRSVSDVLTGDPISNELFIRCDGAYAWRSDLAYYFRRYHIALPERFVQRALSAPAKRPSPQG